MVLLQTKSHLERYSYIDSTLECTREMLADNAVQTSLGHSALRLVEIVNQLYIPNIKQGYIKDSRAPDDTSIAIVSLNKGEKVKTRGRLNSLHASQKGHMIDFINSITGEDPLNKAEEVEFIRQIDTELRKKKLQLDIGEDTVGQTLLAIPKLQFTARNAAGEQPHTLIYGRPSIVLGYFPHRHVFQRALTVLHESKHVLQIIDAPVSTQDTSIFNKSMAIERELEAYHTEAAIVSALFHTSVNAYFYHQPDLVNMTTMRIEEVRARFNKDREPFASSRQLEEALSLSELDILR